MEKKMDYIIRDFNKKTGQIVVEFAGKWTFAIDLPVENNLYPTGEELEKVIQAVAPTFLLERETINQNVTNADDIAALVVPVKPVPLDFTTTPEEALQRSIDMQNSDVEFIKELVNKILTEKGL